MTSKERVIASINHCESDKVPVDFGSTGVTGMHVNVVVALRDYYGLEKRPVKVHEPYQLLGLIEEDLQQAIGIDVEGATGPKTMFGFRNENWRSWRLDSGLEVLVSEHFKTTKDENGNTLLFPKGDTSAPPSARMPKGGFFFDTIIRQEPIDEDKLDPEDNLEEFTPISDADLDWFAQETKRAAATGRAVMMGLPGTGLGDIALVPAPFLAHPKGIRDVEEWYISTVARQDYIHAIFDKQTQIALQNLEKIKTAVGDNVDAVFICGTDFGTQNSTFCSENTYRNLYMPYYKRINNWIHANTNWKTFKHSCGAVEAFINDFIESGFDILNPVQISAAGMEPQKLKEKYGDRIVFWGGGIDTQLTLPFKKTADVREQVLRNMEIFSKNGGFVFNTVHNIQGNTPVENVVAMIEAIQEFNGTK
ncbi:MAG: methyltransferase [Calditrichaeota bacterium]|nr:methyltransferase [Calditrichota bacterium]